MAKKEGIGGSYDSNKYPPGYSAINNKTDNDPVPIHGVPIDAENPAATSFVLGADHPAPKGAE